MTLWLKKPSKDQSVSLSFLALSFVYLIIMSTLLALERTKTMGGSLEMFGICAGLYFGRGLNISNNTTLNGSNETNGNGNGNGSAAEEK